jgi:hypothetical protein
MIKGNDGSFEYAYGELENDKQPYIQAAYECAMVTKPSQFPRMGSVKGTPDIVLPYTSIGGKAVDNLASKLMLSLFPLTTSFFEIATDDPEKLISEIISQLGDSEDSRKQAKEMLDFWFDSVEKLISSQLDTQRMRQAILQALTQLIISGNCLLVFSDDADLKVFRLYDYVVKRDIYGNPSFICIKQDVRIDDLDDETKTRIMGLDDFLRPSSEEIVIYTAIERIDDKYIWNMEFNKQRIYEDRKFDINPFIALRVGFDDGDYGYSFVYEQALSDLTYLNSLIESHRKLIKAMSRTILFNDPLGGNEIEDVAEAKDFDVISGNAQYITTLQIEKRADLAALQDSIDRLKRDIQLTFLMTAGVQRSGERVTAFEIQQLTNDLNESIGGLYSDLVNELQHPLLDLIADQLYRMDKLPNLRELDIKLTVTAGLHGIGRNIEFQSMITWLQTLPETTLAYINWEIFTRRSARLAGVKIDGLIKTMVEVKQEQEQAMMQQMALQASAPVANNMSKNMGVPNE